MNKNIFNKITIAIIVCLIACLAIVFSAKTVYADEIETTGPTESTTEPTEPKPTVHKCEWGNEKWTWTVDNNGLASYVLKIKCKGCNKEVSYQNQSKLYPLKNDKTFSPTCTKDGANFYSTEVQHDGLTFVGTHEYKIPATGHSCNISNPKYEIAVDQDGKQYHYLKCTNKDCPDGGKVMKATCAATGQNAAVCVKKATCDICKNTFGDVLEHKYVNGICENCKKEHSPHTWENGICTGCNFEHKDHRWLLEECQVCKLKHNPHDWDRGMCKVCGFVSSEHQWKDGICTECNMEHSSHQWENGTCAICLLVHQHERWSNGKCVTCQLEHDPHEWDNGICKVCKFKHDPHQYKDGACEVCDVICKHPNFKNGFCNTCGYSDYQIYIGSVQQFTLNSKDKIVIKTNAPSTDIKEVLIDNYPVEERYIKCIGKEVHINNEFLNRLDAGTHEMVLVYENGSIETTFEILNEEAVEIEGNIWMYICLGLILVIIVTVGIIVAVYRFKQEREETMAEKYARQHQTPPARNTQTPTQTRHIPTPAYTEEDEEEMVKKIEDEIGMSVSKFLNEDNKNQ